MINHPTIPKPNPNANAHSIDDLMRMEVVIVDANACNITGLAALDLSSFSTLKVFEVGDYSFTFVNEVKFVGLNQLERVVVGKHSFRRGTMGDPNRHFYLKNCERVRELKIGRYSFNDYSVCEIENVPSLEVIEIGRLDRWNGRDDRGVFSHASKLELKSDCSKNEMMNRFA